MRIGEGKEEIHLLRHDDAGKSWLVTLHAQSHLIILGTACEADVILECMDEETSIQRG